MRTGRVAEPGRQRVAIFATKSRRVAVQAEFSLAMSCAFSRAVTAGPSGAFLAGGEHSCRVFRASCR
eukprot:1752911-Lingulodinium_polyedra.AAC.2